MRVPNQFEDDSGVNPLIFIQNRALSRNGRGESAPKVSEPAFAGKATNSSTLQRSIPLSCFAPLAAIDGVRLISLLKNQDLIEVQAEDGRFVIAGLGDDFDSGADSFVDCAAVMEYVDIIVTSDTAIAHLAGALGKPVFLALKHVPDWRWLMHRDDCSW